MDRLLVHVREIPGRNPFDGAAYVFRNRAATRIKVLCSDARGTWLAVGRLQEGRFVWPSVGFVPFVGNTAAGAFKAARATQKAAAKPGSRAARRQAMREAGIPTSQSPVSQSQNMSGYEYSYDIRVGDGGTQHFSVQQQTLDRSHMGQRHWECW